MLGIDVSKDALECTLRDAHTRKIVWEQQVGNSCAGIQALLHKTPPQVPWVVEPTGRYSALLVEQAQAAGRAVLLAPPRKAKAFLQSLQSRAKTDKLDSRGLALYGLSQPLAPYPVKEVALDTLDQHLSARKGLSGALSKLRLQAQQLPLARGVLEEAITSLQTQIKALDKQIALLTAQEPKVAIAKNLRQVPGIGAVTAAAVASRLASKQFSHPDQFVAYIGLDIHVVQSGQHKGQRGLTHQGDAELRRLLYVCAQASVRAKESPFRQQYEREKAKGLSSTAALCAIARKMAKLCWSLHKYNATYDPDRVYAAPERGKAKQSAQTPALLSPPLDTQP